MTEQKSKAMVREAHQPFWSSSSGEAEELWRICQYSMRALRDISNGHSAGKGCFMNMPRAMCTVGTLLCFYENSWKFKCSLIYASKFLPNWEQFAGINEWQRSSGLSTAFFLASFVGAYEKMWDGQGWAGQKGALIIWEWVKIPYHPWPFASPFKGGNLPKRYPVGFWPTAISFDQTRPSP